MGHAVLRREQDVGALDLFFVESAACQRVSAGDDIERIARRFEGPESVTDIDSDNKIGAKLAGCPDRHGFGPPAIDQQAAVEFDRIEHSRHSA